MPESNTIARWWNTHNNLDLFSGAWTGFEWIELPDHIQAEIIEIYQSAQPFADASRDSCGAPE